MRQGAKGLCAGMTLRYGMGREEEGVQDGGHMYIHGWFTWMYGKTYYIYCKVISFQLKEIIKKKNEWKETPRSLI